MIHRIIQVALACCVLLSLVACVPQVNYSIASVPEEGGIRFVKITDDSDGVCHPAIDVHAETITMALTSPLDVSKDGTKVAFVAWKNEKRNIYIKDTTTSRATLQRTFRANVLDCALSADGKNLAFADYREGNWNIYMTGALQGSAVRQISNSRLDSFYPVFSPDDKTVLFTQNESVPTGNPQEREVAAATGQQIGMNGSLQSFLWSLDLETSALTQYAAGCTPSFCPDGDHVAISRVNTETHRSEIWLVSLKTGTEVMIASDSRRSFLTPSVSPSGKLVAFVSRSEGPQIPTNLDIYYIKSDGTGLTQITFHPGDDVCPRWGKDDHELYFLSQRGSVHGEWNIWKMDIHER